MTLAEYQDCLAECQHGNVRTNATQLVNGIKNGEVTPEELGVTLQIINNFQRQEIEFLRGLKHRRIPCNLGAIWPHLAATTR